MKKAKADIGSCQDCDRQVQSGLEMCFDFDHIDPTTKANSVSQMMSASEVRIAAEIAKCRLLCCYCHKDRTAKQRGYHYVKTTETESKAVSTD